MIDYGFKGYELFRTAELGTREFDKLLLVFGLWPSLRLWAKI